MKKRTKWFRMSIDPAYVGVYEVLTEHLTVCYAYWNGTRWGWSAKTKSTAFLMKGHVFGYLKKLAWRGLAKIPPEHKRLFPYAPKQ